MCSVNCVVAGVEKGGRGGTIRKSFSLKAGSTEWGWVGGRGVGEWEGAVDGDKLPAAF